MCYVDWLALLRPETPRAGDVAPKLSRQSFLFQFSGAHFIFNFSINLSKKNRDDFIGYIPGSATLSISDLVSLFFALACDVCVDKNT